jgi:heme oxygenase
VSARAALRAATADAHDRVDRLFSRLDLARPGDYRLFLQAQASAHLPIEAALDDGGIAALLPDWPERRRAHLLVADLAALGIDIPAPVPPPLLSGPHAMLGAAYVLEGSRLGGAVLKRSLSPGAPVSFLNASQMPGAWRKLLERMDHFLYETAALEAAVGAARNVFNCFEAGGLRYLESRVK